MTERLDLNTQTRNEAEELGGGLGRIVMLMWARLIIDLSLEL